MAFPRWLANNDALTAFAAFIRTEAEEHEGRLRARRSKLRKIAKPQEGSAVTREIDGLQAGRNAGH
jgi:hypothetical protein